MNYLMTESNKDQCDKLATYSLWQRALWIRSVNLGKIKNCTSRLSARREADLPAEHNHFLSTNNVSRFGKYPIKEVYATSRIKDDGQLFGNKSSFIFFFLSGKKYEVCVNSATCGHRRARSQGSNLFACFLFVFPCNSSSASESFFVLA